MKRIDGRVRGVKIQARCLQNQACPGCGDADEPFEKRLEVEYMLDHMTRVDKIDRLETLLRGVASKETLPHIDAAAPRNGGVLRVWDESIGKRRIRAHLELGEHITVGRADLEEHMRRFRQVKGFDRCDEIIAELHSDAVRRGSVVMTAINVAQNRLIEIRLPGMR